MKNNIKFIDVGMGIQNVDNKLTGVLRVTTCTEEKIDHIDKRISFVDNIENEYKSNIQIAELNAMNAALAVIKWKKIIDFYHDFEGEFHSTYTIDTNLLTSDDYEA